MYKFLMILMIVPILISLNCGDDNPINNNGNNGNEHFNYVFNIEVGGTGWEWGRDIVAVPTGGYVVTGWTDSYGQGRNDLYLIRVAANGDIVWDEIFGGTQINSDDHGDGVTLTPDGNILAAGMTNAFGGGYQSYIVKVDMDGDLIWENQVGTAAHDSKSQVFTISDGYIIGGNAEVNEDFYIRKIDFDGNLVWDSVFTGIDERFRCMTPTTDGGFILGGSTIIKVDQNGVIQWSDPTLGDNGGQNEEDIFSVIETSDGSILASGFQSPNSSNDDFVYVVKYNSIGTIQWNATFEFEGQGFIVENTDGTFSIAYTNPTSGEIFIAEINATGNLVTNLGTGINGLLGDMIMGHSGFVLTGIDYHTDPNGDIFIAEIVER
jgi:hypothetical protein